MTKLQSRKIFAIRFKDGKFLQTKNAVRKITFTHPNNIVETKWAVTGGCHDLRSIDIPVTTKYNGDDYKEILRLLIEDCQDELLNNEGCAEDDNVPLDSTNYYGELHIKISKWLEDLTQASVVSLVIVTTFEDVTRV